MYQLEGAQIQRGQLSPGRRGTAETLAIMRRLALEGSSMLEVRRTAQQIIRQRGVPPHDYPGELRAVFEWVRDRIRYLRDPVGTEWLQTPARTLRDRVGDCDDKATLLTSLLLSIGTPAQLAYRVIGTNPFSGAFGHVYVVARVNGRRIPLDATRRGTRFGWEYPRPAVAGEVGL